LKFLKKVNKLEETVQNSFIREYIEEEHERQAKISEIENHFNIEFINYEAEKYEKNILKFLLES